REALLTRIYSNNCSSQRQQQQNLLATQLLYAQFLQQPQTQCLETVERDIKVHLLEFPGLKKTPTENESSSSLLMNIAQDNNNNLKSLSDIAPDDDHQRDREEGSLNNTLHDHRKKYLTSPTGKQTYIHSKSYFFREQKNILFDIKKGLEKWALLCSKFQLNLSASRQSCRSLYDDEDYDVDEQRKMQDSSSALEFTVQMQLKSNRQKIDNMIVQVRSLYHQWSSAELYYIRSLQRLGLSPDIDIGSSYGDRPNSAQITHDTMALAAIALSAECDRREGNPENDSNQSAYTHMQKSDSRTLQDIENIILAQAAAVASQKTSSGNDQSESAGYSDNDEETKPLCIWHQSSNCHQHTEPIQFDCSTASEIVLEFVSQSRLKNALASAINGSASRTPDPAPNATECITKKCPIFNLSPVAGAHTLKPENIAQSMNDPGYFVDIQFPPTPSTPPTSSNSSCSTGPLGASFSSNTSRYHNRRKSRFARRIDLHTTSSSLPNINATNQSTNPGMHLNGSAFQDVAVAIASLPVCPKTSAASRAPPTASYSTVATAAAFQDRTITNMLKAQFNSLTTTNGSKITNGNTASGIGIAKSGVSRDNCDGITAFDAPYDLSIGSRLQKINLDSKSSSNSQPNDCKDSSNDKKKPHIKKPLNAFMLYMKEMRAKVVAECTLKESAAINQILGRRWHELSREEQSKYYEKARQERQLHMELYPGWSARDNYGYVSKKKKRKKDRSTADSGGNNMKKCRARFGLDQQNQWCKPCRRKKKCIRYMEALNGGGRQEDGNCMDDLGNMSQLSDEDDDDDDADLAGASGGSGDEAEANKMVDPEDTEESTNQSMSSPGCLSGLSSLQSSTTTSLASPLNMNMLTSPPTPQTLPTVNMLSLAVNADQATAFISQQTKAAVSVGSGSSSSVSTCSIINTPNTSSASSPATSTSGLGITNGMGTSIVPTTTSTNERAMMLGTRFSHLGMGLSLPSDQIFQTNVHHRSTGSGPNSSITNTSSTTLAKNGFSTYSAPVNSTTSGSKVVIPISTSLTVLPTTTSTLHRNPIGANPRDINNPLSINQLTKRREDHNITLTDVPNYDSQSTAASITSLRHNPYMNPHAAHPHPHHSLFSSSFTQHFQQQLSNHLAATSNSTVSGIDLQSAVLPIDTPNINMKRRNTSDPQSAASGNGAATPNTSDTGAISVS
ncbi:hypothetical protein KR044_005145, partial [Drosophila immigrans]